MREREVLAALCHSQWSGWMKYLFSKCKPEKRAGALSDDALLIPGEFVYRWKRQMNTHYENLCEHEKDSDRKEADKFLELLIKL